MVSVVPASGAARVGGEQVSNAVRGAPSTEHVQDQPSRPPDPETETPPGAENDRGRIEGAACSQAHCEHNEHLQQDKPSAQPLSKLVIAGLIDGAVSGELGERCFVSVAQLAAHCDITAERVYELFRVRVGRVYGTDTQDSEQAQIERASADAAHAQDGLACRAL